MKPFTMYELIVTHRTLNSMIDRVEAQSPDLAWVRKFEGYWSEAPSTLMTRIECNGVVILPE